ncbi:MAG: cytochrome c peroxidase [Bacteroidales bacterium]|nr:cytochrome c peroxidase [Bacteroidales bacterium]
MIKSHLRLYTFLLILFPGLFFISCKKNEQQELPDSAYIYNPTPYLLEIPTGFPDMTIPVDNQLTEEGITLGRKLFHDPILSANNSQSCASCHLQDFSFADSNSFSIGIDGIEGSRNAMALINVGWLRHFNWDGSAKTLEEQAFEPVVNPVEMHNSWPQAVVSLKNDTVYRRMFFEAFGTLDFDSTLVVKAIAQFERTLISSNSKWDSYLRGEISLTQAESRGFEIFFTEKGDCFHCHSTILFTDNDFHNNGLDAAFADSGLFKVTADPNDLGRFRTPTLRNAAFTAPYMHDGRFQTLEEVIDFYSEGLQYSETIDPLMKNVNDGGVQLTEEEKFYLLTFLKTLSDFSFIQNSAYVPTD